MCKSFAMKAIIRDLAAFGTVPVKYAIRGCSRAVTRLFLGFRRAPGIVPGRQWLGRRCGRGTTPLPPAAPFPSSAQRGRDASRARRAGGGIVAGHGVDRSDSLVAAVPARTTARTNHRDHRVSSAELLNSRKQEPFSVLSVRSSSSVLCPSLAWHGVDRSDLHSAPVRAGLRPAPTRYNRHRRLSAVKPTLSLDMGSIGRNLFSRVRPAFRPRFRPRAALAIPHLPVRQPPCP
jgi:hypothetical protein